MIRGERESSRLDDEPAGDPPFAGTIAGNETNMAEATIAPFDWADPFAIDAQLSDEERLVRDTARGYAQEKLQPRVTQAYLE